MEWMTHRSAELDRFKTDINLTQLMAAFGYAKHPKSSSRSSCTMIHPNSDKLIVARGHDGHWIFFSVRDHTDHGTVIDFVQRRTGENLGQVRRRLRDWLRSPTAPALSPQNSYAQDLVPITRDLVLVRTNGSTEDLFPSIYVSKRQPLERFPGITMVKQVQIRLKHNTQES